jgi:hypothetical protein
MPIFGAIMLSDFMKPAPDKDFHTMHKPFIEAERNDRTVTPL